MLLGSALLLLLPVPCARGHSVNVALRETFGARPLCSSAEWSVHFQRQYLAAAEQCFAIKRLIREQSDNFVHLLQQWLDVKEMEKLSMSHSHQVGQASSISDSLHSGYSATMKINEVLDVYYAVLKAAFEKCTAIIFDAYIQSIAASYAHLAAQTTQEHINSEWCQWCELELESVRNSLFDNTIKYFAAFEHQLEALSHDIRACAKIDQFFYSGIANIGNTDRYTAHARYFVEFLRMTKHQYLNATFRKLEMESYRNATILVLNQLELILSQIPAQQV